MPIIGVVAALLAALIHVWFFVLESLRFERPNVAARFGARTQEAIDAVRPMAFNQGFYNLFLAIGVVGGLLLVAGGNAVTGRPIVLFSACMVGAGVVLLASNSSFASAAALQAVPPLVAIVATLTLG